MPGFSGLRATCVTSCRSCFAELEARCADVPAYRLLAALAAQLVADRMRAVCKGSAWLEALPLPTPRPWHRSVECAWWHRDPVKRATREVGMICTRRMNRLERIDMCTVVPYVCNSSQDVENGSLDLVLSSSTRTKAVQAIVIACKERQKSLQDPLTRQ